MSERTEDQWVKLRGADASEADVVVWLGQRPLSASRLQCIGDDPRWRRLPAVRRRLARHPNCPLALARALLRDMPWSDLCEITLDGRVHPSLRQQAESTLLTLLEDMSVGERVALARRAGRGVIAGLLDSNEGRVLESLLGNMRLIEVDAVRLASAARAPGDFLTALARHHRWSRVRAVRLALLGNDRTPVPAALGIVPRMLPEDLRRLAASDRIPRIVRLSADRELARRRPESASTGMH